VPGPNGREGGIVSSSRAILFPESAGAVREVSEWESALDAALGKAVDELAAAIQS